MKTIFVTGGVVSSLGKGIVASIISGLLVARGFKTKLKKIDPYLNVDPGTLNPSEHGEVYVTWDGMEADLDLGHYERLGNTVTSANDYITSGSIYQKIIKKEREGGYDGQTVQVIPHFTKTLTEAIFAGTEDVDFLICEVGGTVGDIESIAILETIRQIKFSHPDVLSVHVGLMPFLSKPQEWKTKAIQHSVRNLLNYGIQTDILICRMEKPNEGEWKEKLANLSNLHKENVFCALDADTIYHAMENYEKEGICKRILEIYNLKNSEPNLNYLYKYIERVDSDLPRVTVGIIGKYVECKDSYKSVEEAIAHASAHSKIKTNLQIINAETVTDEELKKLDGIFIPGGFGIRAINGKIKAIKFAKKHNIPLLGMCLGMQLSVIEGLQALYPDANSTEFDPSTKNPVILKMIEWKKDDKTFIPEAQIGGSMRLGYYECELVPNTLTHQLYGKDRIKERHRHRYIFNNDYKEKLAEVGFTIAGYTLDNLVEIVERKDCDFFIAGQFHAEFESRIQTPHPLFVGFIEAIKKQKFNG